MKQIFKKFDIFAQPFTIKFDKTSDKHYTMLGGICTLIFLISFLGLGAYIVVPNAIDFLENKLDRDYYKSNEV